MISYEELLNAPVTDLSQKTLIDASFDGTEGMCNFSREVMVPLLTTLLSPSPQEIAVRDTYYRMCLLLRSVIALNRLDHFQSVASATRTMFELWIELELVARDTTGGEAAKFYAFAEIERYRRAEQIVTFADANPHTLRTDIGPQRAFYGDVSRQTKMATLLRTTKTGRPNYPDHWTRKHLRDRAKTLGQEAMYVETYPLLSWFVHAGTAGTAGMSKQALEAVFGYCHSLVQRIFVAATSTCSKATKISKLDYFDRWMTGLKLKTGELILSEQIKLLEAKRAQA